jgi:hypothetical protein
MRSLGEAAAALQVEVTRREVFHGR